MKKKGGPFLYLFLRFFTLGIRFLFIAYFFRYSESLYGEYGLIATTVALGVYWLGLEFYTYSHREYLQKTSGISHLFLHQLTFNLLAYIILLPVFYLFFAAGFLRKSYLLLFYILLVTEHLSLELQRLLFTLKKPLAANINLLLRNGLWMLPLVFYFYRGRPVNINEILKYWIAGDLAALLTGMFVLWPSVKNRFASFRPDLEWIKKGFYTGLPYFFGVMSLKIIEFSDRYFIDYYYDKATVGIYTFFGNFSILISTVVFTAVFSLRYPDLVGLLARKNIPEFTSYFQKLQREVMYWTLLTASVLLISMPVVLKILHKQQHLHYYPAFVLLVTAYVFFNLSFLYHYILYGLKKDKWLLYAAIMAMLLNVGLNFFFVPAMGITGAAITTLIAMAFLWGAKFMMARKIMKKYVRDKDEKIKLT